MKLFMAMWLALVPLQAKAGLVEQCAQARNDDTVRGYDPSLKAGLLKAYATLFPRAQMPPDDRMLRADAHIRCMDGRLLACFTGANLPCGKMNAAQDNSGADTFCRANPDATVVPAFATGHDAAYRYRCVAGQAEITGDAFPLDSRGFAASLWAPAD